MLIMIVEDHTLMRDAVARILRGIDESITTIGERDLSDAVATIQAGAAPDLIVLDMVLPDSRGVALVNEIAAVYPLEKVVAYSGQEDRILIRTMHQLGVRGYILKSSTAVEEEFAKVLAGKRSFPPLPAPVEGKAKTPLTSEEIQILQLMASPDTSGGIKCIAQIRGITERAARRKWLRVREKLDARNKGQALARARQMGISLD